MELIWLVNTELIKEGSTAKNVESDSIFVRGSIRPMIHWDLIEITARSAMKETMIDWGLNFASFNYLFD